MQIGKKLRRVLLILLLTLVASLVWIPLWMLVTGSLMGEKEILQNLASIFQPEKASFATFPILPEFPTLRPYAQLMLDTPEFFVMFWNSCKQVFPILFGQVFLGAPAAWALARYHFRGRRMIQLLYIVLMLMPFQVTMVSSYLLLDQWNLINTIWAVIIPGAVSTFPVFIMERFFEGIPESLIEAAALDGCGPLRIFFHVGLPLGAPGILSAVVLGFFEYWNAIEQPLAFLKDRSLWPLALYLPNVTASNAGVSLAASIIMLTPALLIFLFGQKYLEQGIAASGLKD